MIYTSDNLRATVRSVFLMCSLALCGGCVQSEEAPAIDPMNPLAEEYVHLGLLMQNHDKLEYVYIGPEEWRERASESQASMPEIQADLASLKARINALPARTDAMEQDRLAILLARVTATNTRLDILQDRYPASFDEETALISGVKVPHNSEAHFRALTTELNNIIPGEGELSERVERFRDQFVIPADEVEAVMTVAMKECRKRTKAHIALPQNESVTLNITTDKYWSAFTEYRGDSQTVVHINRDVPIHVERILQLACHEAYPGHHTHGTLTEAEVLDKRDWVEYAYMPLHSPLSVISEGAANYGVDLAFPREERIEYERSVILPLAGLDGEQLELYYEYFDLMDELNFSRNEVARHYLYGGMSKEDAIAWLMKFGIETHGTASQRLDFIEALRTYVINYNYGKTLVRRYVESRAGDNRDEKWRVFTEVLSSPMLPHKMLRQIEMAEAR